MYVWSKHNVSCFSIDCVCVTFDEEVTCVYISAVVTHCDSLPLFKAVFYCATKKGTRIVDMADKSKWTTVDEFMRCTRERSVAIPEDISAEYELQDLRLVDSSSVDLNNILYVGADASVFTLDPVRGLHVLVWGCGAPAYVYITKQVSHMRRSKSGAYITHHLWKNVYELSFVPTAGTYMDGCVMRYQPALGKTAISSLNNGTFIFGKNGTFVYQASQMYLSPHPDILTKMGTDPAVADMVKNLNNGRYTTLQEDDKIVAGVNRWVVGHIYEYHDHVSIKRYAWVQPDQRQVDAVLYFSNQLVTTQLTTPLGPCDCLRLREYTTPPGSNVPLTALYCLYKTQVFSDKQDPAVGVIVFDRAKSPPVIEYVHGGISMADCTKVGKKLLELNGSPVACNVKVVDNAHDLLDWTNKRNSQRKDWHLDPRLYSPGTICLCSGCLAENDEGGKKIPVESDSPSIMLMQRYAVIPIRKSVDASDMVYMLTHAFSSHATHTRTKMCVDRLKECIANSKDDTIVL